MFFQSKAEKITVHEFDVWRNNICVYRAVGGLGDIIAMRMIFEDFKIKYPDFQITWVVPYKFMKAAERHPFVDKVIALDDFHRNDYVEVFNVTTVCGRYEVLNRRKNEKNRSDIWAEHFGLVLENHNIFMPTYKNLHEKIYERLRKLGWDNKKKLVAFAPSSAISIKNMTFEQIKAVKEFTKEHFLFVLHNCPILDVSELGIPAIYDFRLEESLGAIELSDYVIATDTGLLHAAAGYKKPTLGTFSFVDGKIYCKYYPTVQVVQLHYDEFPGWCGPCYDFPRCPFTEEKKQKPCQKNISPKMLLENWHKLLNKV